MSEWETRQGQIVLCPLTGFATAQIPMLVALRLVCQSGPDAPKTGDIALQVGMFAAQARELGLALIQAAERAEKTPPGQMQ